MKSLFSSRRISRLCLASSLFAPVLGAHLGAAQAQAQAARPAKIATKNALTAAQKRRQQVFEQVWSTVDQKYYDPKFNGVDWRAMHDKYLPRAQKAAGEAQFYAVLDAMLEELKDKHTSVTPPQRQRETDSGQETSVGLRLTLAQGVLVVYRVTPGSDAARFGIKAGMRVKTIAGKAVSQAALRNPRLGALIAGEPGTLLKIELTRPDGSPLRVGLWRRLVDSPEPVFEARLLKSGNAYIKFGQFTSPIGEQVKAALVKFKNAPGLVLDLRDNPGGQQSTESQIAGFFFNDEVYIGRRLTRTGKPMTALWGFIQWPGEIKVGEKGGQLFAHPLAILINGRSASASEGLASALQEQKRAYVVGTRSVGALLGIRGGTRLKDGGELRVSELGFLTAQGRKVEGRGVIPDRPVPLTIADLRIGRDAALAAAEEYLVGLRASRSKPQSPPTPIPKGATNPIAPTR